MDGGVETERGEDVSCSLLSSGACTPAAVDFGLACVCVVVVRSGHPGLLNSFVSVALFLSINHHHRLHRFLLLLVFVCKISL